MAEEHKIVPIGLNPEIPARVHGPRTLTSRFPCSCYNRKTQSLRSKVFFHGEKQDTACDGWKHLLQLIDRAAADKQEKFDPLEDLTLEERRQVITLPRSIAKLTQVRNFNLYDSNLVRIPPEIGEMASLETFIPYTSSRLHWFPYEITRCKQLSRTLVSTRALYGNVNFRPPFPRLQPDRASTRDLALDELQPGIWGPERMQNCSVCNRPLAETGLYQAWISLWLASYDVLPLLVNACSEECLRALPMPPKAFIQEPHKGGPGLEQPPGRYSLLDAEGDA